MVHHQKQLFKMRKRTLNQLRYKPNISIVSKRFHVVVLLSKQLPDYLPEHDPHVAVDSDTVSGSLAYMLTIVCMLTIAL